MSERISSCQFSEEQQIRKVTAIGNEATKNIDRTYGRGYPVGGPATQELAFHNGHHSRTVGRGAFKICTRLGLPRLERAVAGAAGKAHDIKQLKGRGLDERESADWLTEQMEKTGAFPPGVQHMGALAIIGTEPLFKNGQIVGQRANELEYPNTNAELVAKSVASADMGILYTPEGPYISHQLFREVCGMPDETSLPFEKIARFQQGTIDLVETYEYPLPEAERLLATHRPEVTAFHHELLATLKDGTIGSWDELLRYDLAFIKKHRG